MQTERKGELSAVQVGSRRTKKLIYHLNKISKERYGGEAVFSMSAGPVQDGRIHPMDNTKEKRYYGGGVGIAITCTWQGKKIFIHPRAALTVHELRDATLTTESKSKTKYGLLIGSLVMAILIDDDEEPIKCATFLFDDLDRWGCVEPRDDKSTNVRVHLNKVAQRLIPLWGRKNPVGLLLPGDDIDAVGAVLEFMK
jgi:hypothetical protein